MLNTRLMKLIGYIIVIVVCLICTTYMPRKIITIDPKNISYIHIFNGNTGASIDISDQEIITHLITNLSNYKFKKGKFAPFQMGYSYEILIYNQKGNLYKKIMVSRDNIIRYHGFFFYGVDASINYDYIDSLFFEI